MPTTPATPIKLYRHPLSGHAHRAQLMLSLLNLPTQLVDVDLMKGAHKQAEFLALNPFGQVPVVDDNGTIVADSDLAHAPEGNVSLADYPKVREWLARIEGLPGFVGMQKTAVGLAI